MGRIFGQFDTGYLINLPERTDRLTASEAELRRMGWLDNFHVLSAYRFEDAGGFANRAERGCFQSHLACLRLAAESNSSVLILEDDITLAAALPSLEQCIAEQLCSKSWDIVHFGHEETGPIPRASRSTSSVSFTEFSELIFGAHFYGVHREIVGPLVEFLETLLLRQRGDERGGPMPLDGGLTTFRLRNPGVRALVADPKLGWQRPSRSDITPGRWDSIKALAPVLRVARQLKTIIQNA